MKHLKFAWLLLVLLTLAACGRDVAPDALEVKNAAVPTITSDKEDYRPGELVTLTGSNWQPGESVHINVDDDQTKTWERNVDVTADENGDIVDKFNLPNHFVATYQVVATGEVSGVAKASFTDGNVGVTSSPSATGANEVKFVLKHTVHTAPNPNSNNSCTSNNLNSAGPDVTVGSTTTGNSKNNWALGVDSKDSVRLEAAANASQPSGWTFSHWAMTNPTSGAFFVIDPANPRVICVTGNFTGARDFQAVYQQKAATSVSEVSGSGTYGGNGTLTAKLSSGSINLSGKTVEFKLNDNVVGTATTNNSGVATLSNVSLTGINAGTYANAVSARFAGDSSYSTSNGTGSLTVSKATGSVSISNIPGSAIVGGTFTPNYTKAGDGTASTTSNSTGICTVTSSGVVNFVAAGTCRLQASVTAGTNHLAATGVEQTFTIAAPPKQNQTITFTQPTSPAAFGSTFKVAPTSSSNLSVSVAASGSCSISDGTVTMSSGTGTCTLKASQAGNDSYNAADDVTRTVNASKANQTVSFADNTPTNKTEGDPEFTVSASATSRLAVVFSAKAESTCTVSNTGDVSNLEEGTCTVVASQGGNDNYNAAVNAEHAITVAAPPKKDQAITFAQPASPQVYRSTFNVNPTASSKLDVMVTVDGVCELDGNKVTMTSGTGDCHVTATQAGNRYYNAAPPVLHTIAAAKADQTISWDAPDAITYGTALGNDQLNASTNGGGTLTYDPAAGAVLDAGNRTLRVDAAATTNYNAASATVDLTVNKAPASITIADARRAYGAANPSFSIASFTGVRDVSGLGCTLSSNADASSPAGGTHDITAICSNNNYKVEVTKGTLTITKAPASINLSNLSHTYDGNAKAASASTSPSGISGLSITYGGSATAPTNAGRYNVVASLSNNNYEAADATDTLVIGKASTTTTVSCPTASLTYDGSEQSPCSARVTGAGDLNESLAVIYDNNTNAGTATASASYAESANHLASSDRKTFTINKATATVALSNLSHVFDGTAKSASATTSPAGLNVSLSYSPSSPLKVGSYSVTATISEQNYQGGASGTLIISAWTLKGFYSPVDMTSTSTIVWNTAKNGSTVPLKFNVFAGTTERTSTADIQGFSAVKVTCSATGIDDAIEEFATTGGTSLRYSDSQFIQNWATPKSANTCYKVTVTTRDASSISAYFKLK